MRHVQFILISISLFFLLQSSIVIAADTSKSMLGLDIRASDDGGAYVSMPGLEIDVQQRGAVLGKHRVPRVHSNKTFVSYANADLSGIDFRNKSLVGADFSNTNLNNVDFSGSDLTGANFKNADFTSIRFVRTNLSGVNFRNTNFSNCDISYANFTRADLSNADFSNTVGTGALFEGAILNNVDLSLLIRRVVQKQVLVRDVKRPLFTSAQTISRELRVAKRIDLTINFDFDSDRLTGEGVKQIAALAAALNTRELRGSHIVLEGHTDSVGDVLYNQGLSYRRASRALITLRDQYRVPSALLEAKGCGEERSIASNKTDLGRALNRRVTVINKGR